jgi:hypothetical protein
VSLEFIQLNINSVVLRLRGVGQNADMGFCILKQRISCSTWLGILSVSAGETQQVHGKRGGQSLSLVGIMRLLVDNVFCWQ